jgi:hypothetical protein
VSVAFEGHEANQPFSTSDALEPSAVMLKVMAV